MLPFIGSVTSMTSMDIAHDTNEEREFPRPKCLEVLRIRPDHNNRCSYFLLRPMAAFTT